MFVVYTAFPQISAPHTAKSLWPPSIQPFPDSQPHAQQSHCVRCVHSLSPSQPHTRRYHQGRRLHGLSPTLSHCGRRLHSVTLGPQTHSPFPRLLNLEQGQQSISRVLPGSHGVHGNPEGRGHLQSSDPEPAAPAHTAAPWAPLCPVLGASEDSWLCLQPLGWSSLPLSAACLTLALSSSPSSPTPILQPLAGLAATAAHQLAALCPIYPLVHPLPSSQHGQA